MCELGQYMTPTPFSLPPSQFTGCKYDCPSGTYGATNNLTDPYCTGVVPPQGLEHWSFGAR